MILQSNIYSKLAIRKKLTNKAFFCIFLKIKLPKYYDEILSEIFIKKKRKKKKKEQNNNNNNNSNHNKNNNKTQLILRRQGGCVATLGNIL